MINYETATDMTKGNSCDGQEQQKELNRTKEQLKQAMKHSLSVPVTNVSTVQ